MKVFLNGFSHGCCTDENAQIQVAANGFLLTNNTSKENDTDRSPSKLFFQIRFKLSQESSFTLQHGENDI